MAKTGSWSQDDISFLVGYYKSNSCIDLNYLETVFIGKHKTNICRKARSFGLTNQSRPPSDLERKRNSASCQKNIAEKGHNRGYLGHHPSEETRRLISDSSKKMWARAGFVLLKDEHRQANSDRMSATQKAGKLRNSYSRGKMGKRDDLDGLYVRSSWEANYARYLNWLVKYKEISRWEYESETFEFSQIKRGTRSYLPDFKVYNNDGTFEYHEVKGWMDDKSKIKLERMTKYYPHIKIVLIDADQYRCIAKTMKKFISEWE
jgi:hypothetical protein